MYDRDRAHVRLEPLGRLRCALRDARPAARPRRGRAASSASAGGRSARDAARAHDAPRRLRAAAGAPASACVAMRASKRSNHGSRAAPDRLATCAAQCVAVGVPRRLGTARRAARACCPAAAAARAGPRAARRRHARAPGDRRRRRRWLADSPSESRSSRRDARYVGRAGLRLRLDAAARSEHAAARKPNRRATRWSVTAARRRCTRSPLR